jgi:hypothetical protein
MVGNHARAAGHRAAIAAAFSHQLADAYLRLGSYRAATGEAGSATLRVCKGRYQLHTWKVGYDAAPQAVHVDGDMFIEVAAVIVPEENVDRAWKG